MSLKSLRVAPTGLFQPSLIVIHDFSGRYNVVYKISKDRNCSNTVIIIYCSFTSTYIIYHITFSVFKQELERTNL